MVNGVNTFFAGFYMLLRQQSLRAVLWRMLGLLLVLMVLLMAAVFMLADYFTALWLPEGDAWYWQIVGYVAWVLAVALSMIMGVVGFVALASAAAAPWLDTLAYRTEVILGKPTVENDAPWTTQSFAALVNSIRPLLGLLLWGIVALVFFWIPPVATAIWVYASIQFLSYELFDTQASRYGLVFKQRQQQIKEHRWFWLGFGGISLVLMTIPLLNLLVLPAAVVALARRG